MLELLLRSTAIGVFLKAMLQALRHQTSMTAHGGSSTCRMTGALKGHSMKRIQREARVVSCRQGLAGYRNALRVPQATHAREASSASQAAWPNKTLCSNSSPLGG